MKQLYIFILLLITTTANAQVWQDVGGGTNNSSHGMCIWDNKLIDVGSFNNPCNRVASWNDTIWNCFGSGVGLVGREAIEFNGDLIVVGDFWNVHQPCVGCNGIARWDGTSWQPLGTGFNNDVLCLAIWNGDLLAGGDFTQADGNPVSRIARWTGTQWVGVGGINDFDNDIRAMTVYNGELWVGGDFNNAAGCTSCDGLVKWNGTTWVGGNSGVDINGGVDSTVRVLYVDPIDNLLYMGGHFTGLTANDVYNPNLNGVAVYDGSDWFSLGTGVNSYVRAITRYNNNIIVGGDFSAAGGTSANKIAKWNLSTTNWSAMGSGMNDYVKSAQVYNGNLYVGGPFTIADGQPRNCIAKWFEAPSIPPNAFINSTTTSTCAGQCINFSDNSSNSPTTWTWTFPGGTPSSSVSQNPGSVCFSTAGTYTVTLSACNANGCGTNTQIITISNSPNVLVNNLSLCDGQNGTLNASGASTYTWSPASGLSATTGNSVIANPTTTTTYTVTGTSAGGCSNTATATVTVNSLPTNTASNGGPYCVGQTIQLNTTSGATDYDWSGPGGYIALNSQNPTRINSNLTMNGIYTVTITNAEGCTATSTTTVIVNDIPNATASNTGPYCIGSTIQLNSSGGSNYVWAGPLSYSNNNQNPSILLATALMTGIYSVTVTNASGCSTTATTSVTITSDPVVAASNTGPFCVGETIQLNSSGGGVYSWSGPLSFTDNNQNPGITSASLGMNGIYTVTVTLPGGCTGSATTTVSINSNPITNASNTGPYCSGSSIQLDATGAGDFIWLGPLSFSNNLQNPTINSSTTNMSGDYTVTLTNAAGCSATSTTSVVVEETPGNLITTSGPTSFCDGGSVNLTASTGDEYLWNTTETSQSINVNASGSYSVVVTNNTGCSSTANISVSVTPLPDVSVVVSGLSITSIQSGASYQWVDCDNNFAQILGANNQTFTATFNGNYAVIIIQNGCQDTSVCNAIVNVSIENDIQNNIVQIYPNPADEQLIIQSNIEVIGSEFNLQDISGKIIYTGFITALSTSVDLTALNAGVYFFTLRAENKTQILKLVKK